MDESDERIETEMVGGYPENIPVEALKDRWILAGNVVYIWLYVLDWLQGS